MRLSRPDPWIVISLLVAALATGLSLFRAAT
jgi:hypothetical protein